MSNIRQQGGKPCAHKTAAVAGAEVGSELRSAGYVAHSSADKKWCAVTVRSKPGVRVFMEVTLDTWPTSSTPARDAGSYTTFAGPVYKDLSKPGLCMTWSGSIDIYYNSDRGLCP